MGLSDGARQSRAAAGDAQRRFSVIARRTMRGPHNPLRASGLAAMVPPLWGVAKW